MVWYKDLKCYIFTKLNFFNLFFLRNKSPRTSVVPLKVRGEDAARPLRHPESHNRPNRPAIAFHSDPPLIISRRPDLEASRPVRTDLKWRSSSSRPKSQGAKWWSSSSPRVRTAWWPRGSSRSTSSSRDIWSVWTSAATATWTRYKTTSWSWRGRAR